jgi:hypothetical protein
MEAPLATAGAAINKAAEAADSKQNDRTAACEPPE